MTINVVIKCLLLLPLFLFGACAGDTPEETEESKTTQAEREALVKEFREQFDRLDTAVLARIDQLEDTLERTAADEREAIEHEILYLREIHEEITTRKDNLEIEQRDNQHFFRQRMEKRLIEIESKLNRTPRR